jgi:hypothetical protein
MHTRCERSLRSLRLFYEREVKEKRSPHLAIITHFLTASPLAMLGTLPCPISHTAYSPILRASLADLSYSRLWFYLGLTRAYLYFRSCGGAHR